MAEEKSREDEGGKDEPQAKSGPNVALIILGLLIVQALFVGVAIFLMSKKMDDQNASSVSAEQNFFPEQSAAASGIANIANEVVLPLKLETTANIAGAEGRYLVVTLAVAYDGKNPKNKKIETGLAGIETQLKNKILSYLSSLTLEQLTQNSNIQNDVRANLLRELNSIIPPNIGVLSNVYIEKWIVS